MSKVVHTAKADRYVIKGVDGNIQGSYYDVDDAIKDAEELASKLGETFQVIDTEGDEANV